MLPIWIGAALTAGASLLGGVMSSRSQSKTNTANTALSQKQMDFQERMAYQAQDFEKEMSSSAYQRAMEDMKKAGLNPMLAYQQGGASTPIGKTAPGSMPNLVAPDAVGAQSAAAIAQAGSSAGQVFKAEAEVARIDQEIENLGAQFGLTKEQTARAKEETAKLKAEIDHINAQTTGVEADNAKREALADFIRSNPNAVIVSEFGGQGIVPLTTILGALGLDQFTDYALKMIEKVKENAQSININMPGGVSRPPQSFRDQRR